MAANKKLTGVIKGRTIKAASAGDGALNVTFDDSSTMKIKVAAQTSSDALNGHTIKSVRQSGVTMNLDFTDGSSAQIDTRGSDIERDAQRR